MAIDIDSLNEPQREAVVTTEGPLLVLAGAGSGKTRVLTYRIANLIENHHVAPWEILAITFTNKAAAEMRERLGGLVGPRSRGMWVCTFHSMCVRILRADAERLGFDKNFTIYDTDDQKRLYKEIVASLNLNPKLFTPSALSNKVSAAKNDLRLPKDLEDDAKDPFSKTTAQVYRMYQDRLAAANAFDFDDLLLYTYLLFKHNPDILAAYQDRFRYILVDEYQDTNKAQYKITKLLADGHENLMVVGDDDQSIYSWRGADITNILNFEQDYPNAHVVKLEQNYRSVGNVLAAANAVIANNQHRKAKKLYTTSEDGDKIQVYLASDERDEGRWIAGEIEKLQNTGMSYNQMAVFYRTNAQSRMLEDMLLRAGVPYRIVGGTRFFDRAEIRDVMAYLTCVTNPRDDMAAKRIVNTPKRGIGKTTVEHIERYAAENACSFLDACEWCLIDPEIRPATRKALAEFVQLFKTARTYSGDLRQVVERIIDDAGLISALRAEATDEAQGRIENIQEFYGVVDEFVSTHEDEDAMFAAPTEAVVEGIAAQSVPLAEAADKTTQVAAEGIESEAGVSAPAMTPSFEDGTLFAFDSDLAGNALGSQSASTAEGLSVVEEAAEAEAPARVLRGDSLADLIEWVRLRTDLDTMAEDGHAVTLMTVHSSKGLEFDCVFVAGMEETIFPHLNNVMEVAGLEEERRLAYVAITRARKKLYLTSAYSRQLYGQTSSNPLSRFVTEIPEELRQTTGLGSSGFSGTGWEKRGSRRGIAGSGSEAGEGRVFGTSSASGSRNRSEGRVGQSLSSFVKSNSRASNSGASVNVKAGKKEAASLTFAAGDVVDHKTFGRGKVTKVDGDTLHIRFEKSGQTKKLLKDYAPIVKIV